MRQTFLDAIKENPYEPSNHYVYADWLEENGFDEEALLQREWTPRKQREAELFIQGAADMLIDCGAVEISPDDIIHHATRFLITGREYITRGYMDLQYREDEAEEFWGHFSVLTGIPVPDMFRKLCFTDCSC